MPNSKSTLFKLRDALRAKLSSFAQALKNPKTYSTLVDTGVVLLCVGSLGLLASRVSEIHSLYLRGKVGSRVYMIKADPKSGGGTGFQIKAPSGTNYIMTNSHVCEGVQKYDSADNKQTALVIDDNGSAVRRRIVALSDETDLCLIEGMPGVDGLSLGNDPGVGGRYTVVGHPHLRPTTLSDGEVIGLEDVKIVNHVMEVTNPLLAIFIEAENKPCDMPKNEIEVVPVPDELGGGTVKVCYNVTSDAYMTSIVIYPGNSGSPMVDFWGRVVGVAFAGDGRDNYGEVVSLPDIRTFIAKY